MPAFATIPSRRPRSRTVRPTKASTASRLDTSATSGRTPSPPRLTVSANPCSFTSTATTRAPAPARRSAVALPMPLAAPVTTTTLPSNSMLRPSLPRPPFAGS
jgi:hypothetical protein